jgi:hypothetical protein
MALTVIKPSGTNFSAPGSLSNVNASNVTTANLTVTGTFVQSTLPLVFNDISTQFDGRKTVFRLRINQDSINTVVDSKDLDVSLNGQILSPYVKEQRFPWIAEYDSNNGYRVSGANLIIYNAPAAGDKCVVVYRNNSQTAQVRKYPYSATSIALGD